MSTNRTFSGKPLCMGMSGFSHYETSRADAPQYPPVVLSPTDILEMIQELTALCSDPKFSTALAMLQDHVANMNNPHHTTLDQFAQDIADVLYKEFQQRTQSSISLDDFTKALFEVIHIASDEEITEGICTTAVLSVFGAKKYLSQHDTDEDAHKELFDKIIPGTPIVEDPTFAWYPQFGISDYYLQPQSVELTDAEEEVPYTYVGADGYIHQEEKHKLPIDYVYRTPLVPCFNTRKNFIVDSASCSIFYQNNVHLLEEAEEAPDRSISATAVCQNEDIGRFEHSLIYRNCILPPEQPRTFSLYVKAEEQQNVKISFKDSPNTDIETYAVYNLKENTCLIVNHMDMYHAVLQKLSNGWYRCCFSMYNTKGQVSDLKITFFDSQELDSNDFMTEARGKICAYVWGIQYENGFQPSPYIPTAGKIGVRPGIQIHIPLEEWYVDKSHTYHIDYWHMDIDPSQNVRPILVMMNGTHPSMQIAHEGRRAQVKRFYTYTEVDKEYDIITLQDEVTAQGTSMLQMTHGVSDSGTITRLDTLTSMKTHDALLRNAGTDLYIGCLPDGQFLNGYVGDLIFYPICVSEEEAHFLNGEAYE